MELKYFNNLKGQWLEFSKDDVTFDRYFESGLKALDGVFTSQRFTPERAKEYLTKILKFAQPFAAKYPLDGKWYGESVKQNLFGEAASVRDGFAIPLRDKLGKYGGFGLTQLAQVGLYLLKATDGGIEAKIVPNPTGIACECPG
jgi:hypothetical protein